MPNRGLEKNAAAPPPPAPVSEGPAVEVPYAAAKLRVTGFPVARK